MGREKEGERSEKIKGGEKNMGVQPLSALPTLAPGVIFKKSPKVAVVNVANLSKDFITRTRAAYKGNNVQVTVNWEGGKRWSVEVNVNHMLKGGVVSDLASFQQAINIGEVAGLTNNCENVTWTTSPSKKGKGVIVGLAFDTQAHVGVDKTTGQPYYEM